MKCLGRDERTWAISTQDQCFFSMYFFFGNTVDVRLGSQCTEHIVRDVFWYTDHIVSIVRLGVRITL